MAKQMRATKRCVRCLLRRAKCHSGHVLKRKEQVLAGWCQRCMDCKSQRGFVGHWQWRMGIKRGSFICTKNCVACLSPHAIYSTGHVLLPNKSHVIASWCRMCDKHGFVGRWRYEMGIE